MSIPLTAIEDIIDASGAAGRIEALLPHGVRCRQLTAHTLLTGMMLTLDDGRPAQLTRVHAALTGLPAADQERLGVIARWQTGPHQLTYRQVEHTFRLAAAALGKDEPDGAPSTGLQATCDQLLEASIPPEHAQLTSALAADWTDVETWSRPAPARQHQLRRPRGVLGSPHQQPARPQRRNVLRLLPVGRRHGGRGARPGRARASQADDPLLVRP
jgi:hypothetical protein